jgi:thiol-disulfide isomerase/thioredoxin
LEEWKKTSEDNVQSYLSRYPIDKQSIELATNKINYRYVQLIYSSLNEVEQDKIPSEYLKNADQYSINDDDLLFLYEYRSAIKSKYVASKISRSPLDLQSLYNKINKELRGKTKDFALTALAGVYSMKQSSGDSIMLKKLFYQLARKKQDSNYVSYLRDNKMRYFILGKQLPENVLSTTFLTSIENSHPISFSKLLEVYKGKAVYIDLWASWCFPCRDDIANSSDAKKLLDEKNVTYSYFSTDTDNIAWRKAAEKDEIVANQFRFEPGKYEIFKNFIELIGIPRYLLLDKNQNVKSLYAPRPIPLSGRMFNDLISDLK